MSSDDRDDPPRGNRRPISQPAATHWDDDRRATVGRRRIHTAVRGTTIDGVPVVLAQQTEHGDPVEHEGADRTPVFHLVDAPLTEAGAHELIRWVKRIERKLEDASSDEKRNMSELRKLMAQPPHAAIIALQADVAKLVVAIYGNGSKDQPGFAARLDDHDTVIRPTRSLARWALGGAATAALLVAAFLYHRGGAEQLVTDQIQQLQRASERCDRFIDHRPDPQQGPRP